MTRSQSNQRVLFQTRHRKKLHKSKNTSQVSSIFKLRNALITRKPEINQQQQQQQLATDDSLSDDLEADVPTDSITMPPVLVTDNDKYILIKEEFLECCEKIGLFNHLRQVFNTKQSKTNTMESNALDAEKRSSTALNRAFHFIQESLLYIVSSKAGEKSATNLKPKHHSVEGVFIHLMNHFQFFLGKQLEHLSMLQRAPHTIRVVIYDFEEIFLKFFLVSESAYSLMSKKNVSCIGFLTRYINLLYYLICYDYYIITVGFITCQEPANYGYTEENNSEEDLQCRIL
jgi:hypothetical protein